MSALCPAAKGLNRGAESSNQLQVAFVFEGVETGASLSPRARDSPYWEQFFDN
jgi:hypothetical protein